MYIFTVCLILFVAVTLADSAAPIIRVPLQRRATRTTTRARKRDGLKSKLYNANGSQYLVNIAVGTPAQNFTVTVDTGSGDLWVPGSGCSPKRCPGPRLQETQSSTFQSLNTTFNIKYGIGGVNGTYATDTLSIGQATIPRQQFGVASMTDTVLTITDHTPGAPNSDGILGLGYPSLTAAAATKANYTPFVFQLVQQHLIPNPVFSISLNESELAGWSGQLIFGGVDPSLYTGTILYEPVVRADHDEDYSFWMVQGVGFAADSHQFALGATPHFILDTGSTLSYLPSSEASALASAIVGSGGYTYNKNSGVYAIACNAAKTSNISTLHVQMDAVTLSVPVTQLVIPMDADTMAQASTCMFGIAPNLGSKATYLLGESILRSAYMLFDIGNNRVGLAAATGLNSNVTANQSKAASGRVWSAQALLAVAVASAFLWL